MGDVRESKKRETRQRLSDVATELFGARGFDAVTIEDIAAAAGVSKVTVFNYFARKEDLFLDRQDDVARLLRAAVDDRPPHQAPVAALRRLVDTLVEEGHPFARIDGQTAGWWRVVAGSAALRARVRELGDEAVEVLAGAIAGGVPDGPSRLVAGSIVLTWRTAYAEALRVLEGGGSAKSATAAFLALIDRGFAAARVLGRAAGAATGRSGSPSRAR